MYKALGDLFKWGAILLVLVIVGLIGVAFADFEGKVVGVHDGDTITVDKDGFFGETVNIRMAGIDAPELAQPYGRESQQNLFALVAGERVYVIDHETDKYGRTVGSVFVIGKKCGGAFPKALCNKAGHVFANLYQLQKGYAWYYFKYDDTWGDWTETALKYFQVATNKDIGIFAKGCVQNPSDYRKSVKGTLDGEGEWLCVGRYTHAKWQAEQDDKAEKEVKAIKKKQFHINNSNGTRR